MSKKLIRNCSIKDAELLLKIYPTLEKRCAKIDESISNIGLSYTNGTYRTSSVFDILLDKIEEKNQTINFKLALDELIIRLKPNTLKLALLMIDYQGLKIEDLEVILESPARTVFRRKDTLYLTLSDIVNKSKYKDRIITYIDSHCWTLNILENIKEYNAKKKYYQREKE